MLNIISYQIPLKMNEEISHHYLKQGQYRGLLFNHYLL